ncbi:hypothetical protein GGI04_002183 [Coemansia thaxteri]|nr:hypothetical protein GGI04_002183 [Coemansia thaxteri]
MAERGSRLDVAGDDDRGLYIRAGPLDAGDDGDDGDGGCGNSSSDEDKRGSDDEYMEVDAGHNAVAAMGERWRGTKRPKRGSSRGPHDRAMNIRGIADKNTHHWRSRPPLLPQRMASLVSTVSGATRLSLEITALFWEAVFDTISESTTSGLWLGSAAWEEAKAVALAAASILSPLSSLSPRIVSRLVSSSTAAGYSMVNQSLAAAESLLEGGFSLYTQAVNMGLHAAGEYARLIDALFGSTDTSRVLASFVHMCRREAFEKNPEIRALVDEHGVVGFGSQVLKTIVAWICLQVVTHGRARPYRMDLVYANTQAQSEFCPRKFIDSNGKPLPGRSAAALRTPRGQSPLPVAGRLSNHVGSSQVSADEDDAYFPLSDQEGSRRDPEWDQRLMDALHSLSLRNERSKQPASSPANHQDTTAKASMWNTLAMVRETAAAAQAHDGETSSSDSDLSPLLNHGSGLPPFESAPASLISSPQLAPTPTLRRSHTIAEEPGRYNEINEPPLHDVLPPDDGLQWQQQEFPRKPLLFNLARFISVASAAYGHNFMKVLGLSHGMIDARALIAELGDYEVQHAGGRLSQSSSIASMDQARSPSAARLPRAQPMTSYHTHAAYHAARPESHRRYERRHFRGSRAETPAGPARRPRRRPVSDHPNHFCFAQHTGIPLTDLLFSSYVPPIIPGVSKAASAQASALERKLRHGQRSRRGRSTTRVDHLAADISAPVPAEIASKPLPPPRGWLESIPVVGSIYQNLPSARAALAAVPIIPGLVSRVLGSEDAQSAATKQDPPIPRGSREPTPNQFRRFDKLRQRLVYRNPSIHALVHYIAVDHATRSIVLACRGTLGISDLFIDMICEYETVQLPGHPATEGQTEFRVHSGMWHSAQLLADSSSEVFKEVAEALRLYPEYGLVITGHSLGGGVASLLTLLWSQPLFIHEARDESATKQPAPSTPGSIVGSDRQFVTAEDFGLVTQRPIHCFSFGSPCSTNAALSYYCRGLVTSVANANDVVSFLSIGTCVDILNISAVLSRERGVAEKVVRRFLSTQRTKIGKKLNLFDFDFSKLRAYSQDDEPSDDNDDNESSGYWWSRKATKNTDNVQHEGDHASINSASSNESSQPKRRKTADTDKTSLDDWHWSLVKTLRASMDSEKLYPPGDVYILASPGDDQVADSLIRSVDANNASPSLTENHTSADATDCLPVGLFYCPDVAERFSELRFTRNMFAHHLPSTYERRLSALVHESQSSLSW